MVEYKIVSTIIDEQFRRFREDEALRSGYSDEDLDKAAKELGVRSMADARFIVQFRLFTEKIVQTAQWN